MDKTGSEKCQACGGIFLKTELSDGRCAKCVSEDRKPERKYTSKLGPYAHGCLPAFEV